MEAALISDGTVVDTAATTLTITNSAPRAIVAADSAATVGVHHALQLGASDPSSVDMAAPFTWSVDWGDGSTVETVTAPVDKSVSHTCVISGGHSISITATDKDGGSSDPTSTEVQVGPASSPTPSVSPTVTSSPTVLPTATASPTVTTSPTHTTSPTVTTPPGPPDDLYSTPGHHYVNGRHWFTACERYWQTIRCRTDIWATQVTYSNRHFRPKTGWYFNNLTYLPRMSRVQWAHNPLATPVSGRRPTAEMAHGV